MYFESFNSVCIRYNIASVPAGSSPCKPPCIQIFNFCLFDELLDKNIIGIFFPLADSPIYLSEILSGWVVEILFRNSINSL